MTAPGGERINIEVDEYPNGDPRGRKQHQSAIRHENLRRLGWQVVRAPGWQVYLGPATAVDGGGQAATVAQGQAAAAAGGSELASGRSHLRHEDRIGRLERQQRQPQTGQVLAGRRQGQPATDGPATSSASRISTARSSSATRSRVSRDAPERRPD